MKIVIDTQGNQIKVAEDGNAKILEAIKALANVKQDIVIPAPVVNFSPVIQPSDVKVPVTVQSAPAPVNNITVQPAQVVIPDLPSEATIETDRYGNKKLKVKK